MDEMRASRTRSALEQAGLDALICRLAENVLFLTGYWPRNGFSFVIFPRADAPTLIVPEGEWSYAEKSGIADIRTFGWGQVKDPDPLEAVSAHLEAVASLAGKAVIGYEGRFEAVAPPHMAGEVMVPSEATRRLLSDTLPAATFRDATDLLNSQRAVKTEYEIAKIRIANEVAVIGLKAFKEAVQPGRTEAEVAAMVLAAVHERGIGYKGVESAWCWPLVMSGANTATSHRPYLISSTKVLQEGDLVMLELGTVADGYWSDLTRTYTVGTPTDRQLEVYDVVVTAQKAAIAALKDGAPEIEVDRAARGIVASRGLGPCFVHHTGHGIGFRYHEPTPFLHPKGQGVVRAGMITSVEPGVYIEGWGGLRIEDNVLARSDGGENLSVFDTALH